MVRLQKPQNISRQCSVMRAGFHKDQGNATQIPVPLHKLRR